MLSRTGNRHTVQKFKEIKIQCPQKLVRCAFIGRELTPCVESLLCLTENFINALRCIELFVHLRCIALIGKCKLILEVNKLVINRRCGKHQHLGFYTCANDFVEQFQVTVFFCILAGHLTAVTEVVTFINDNKVVVAPIQAVKVNSV